MGIPEVSDIPATLASQSGTHRMYKAHQLCEGCSVV